jgi:pre-rRNA-processing protein TSR3
MRFSGNTPSRPADGVLPLYLILAGEDHPKACTGRALVRTGRVRELRNRPSVGRAPLLLDPHADRPLSPSDRPRVHRLGLLGVDCSWNRLRDRGGYPSEDPWLSELRERRRLPWLLAANPQHFGRLTELNTAEAFAAAVHILGYPEQAVRILAGFRGGEAFLDLNGPALLAYSHSGDEAGLRAAEVRIFGGR